MVDNNLCYLHAQSKFCIIFYLLVVAVATVYCHNCNVDKFPAVDCSLRGLTAVPDDLPSGTLSL